METASVISSKISEHLQGIKADSHTPCRSLIHTCHAAPLLCSDRVVAFVKVYMVARNIRTASPTFNRSSFLQCVATTLFLVHDKLCLFSHWPPASEIGMLLITTFVELRVVAGRIRKRAGSPQAISRRTCCAVTLRRSAWSEHGMDMAWQVWIRPDRTV